MTETVRAVQSYAANIVTADVGNNADPLFRLLFDPSDSLYSECYWDYTLSGLSQTEVEDPDGRRTDEMFERATFVDWDFDRIWMMPPDGGYPTLQEAPLP